jgi:hypothetical protein
MPSLIRYTYRRAVVRWQQASRPFVVPLKRDARERWPSAAARDQHSS